MSQPSRFADADSGHRQPQMSSLLALVIALVLVTSGPVVATPLNASVDADSTGADNEAVIGITDARGVAGESVAVALEINGSDVAGYQATVTYDPDIVRLESIVGVDYEDPVAAIDEEAGEVTFTQSQVRGEDDPSVARLTFTAERRGETTLELADDTIVNDERSEHLRATREAGTITIGANGGSSIPPTGDPTDADENTSGAGDTPGAESAADTRPRTTDGAGLGGRDSKADADAERPTFGTTEERAGDEMPLFGPGMLGGVGLIVVSYRLVGLLSDVIT